MQKNLSDEKYFHGNKQNLWEKNRSLLCPYSFEFYILGARNRYAKSLLTRIRDRKTSIDERYEGEELAGTILTIEALNAFLNFEKVKVLTDVRGSYVGIRLQNMLKIVGILEGSEALERGVREALWQLGAEDVPLFHIMMDKRSHKCPLVKLPKRFSADDVILVVDDVISTGETMDFALQQIFNRGSPTVIVMVLIAGPFIYELFQKYPSIKVVCIDFDPVVDRKGFLHPGIGDNDKMIFGALEENKLER